MFEYGVILNGSQTLRRNSKSLKRFEYGVILNGSQTCKDFLRLYLMFEYGVILNGSQTFLDKKTAKIELGIDVVFSKKRVILVD